MYEILSVFVVHIVLSRGHRRHAYTNCGICVATLLVTKLLTTTRAFHLSYNVNIVPRLVPALIGVRGHGIALGLP